jgi:hypothetical protein
MISLWVLPTILPMVMISLRVLPTILPMVINSLHQILRTIIVYVVARSLSLYDDLQTHHSTHKVLLGLLHSTTSPSPSSWSVLSYTSQGHLKACFCRHTIPPKYHWTFSSIKTIPLFESTYLIMPLSFSWHS